MRVWTDGAVHVVVGENGVEVHRPKQAPVLHPLWKRARGGFPLREVLAVVEQEPLRAWVGAGRQVRVLSLDAEARVEQTIGAHVLDAVGLGDGRVLACLVPEGAQRACLVIVNDGDDDLSSTEELALPAAPKIAWPGGIWAKDAVPWPEDDIEEGDEPLDLSALAVGYPQHDGSLTFDEVHCSANEHGIAVASVYSGLVVALPPDASRVEYAVRVPTQVGETEIFAARSKDGLVIVLCVEGRQSAILHVAPDGSVLAHRSKIGREAAWGMGPPIVRGDRIAVFEAGPHAENRLQDLKLQDLSVSKSFDTGVRPGGRVSVWATPGGEAFVLGLGTVACVGKRDGNGRLSCAALDRVSPAVSETARVAAAGPGLVKGPPSLALVKSEAARPWEASVGQAFVIDIPFTNQGGVSEGIAVEVSGAATQAGLVTLQRVRVGEAEAALVVKGSAARGELPAVTLPAGSAVEYDRKKGLPLPDVFTLLARVELTAVKAGASILTVRISPLRAAPGRGSVLQGKSVTVRE